MPANFLIFLGMRLKIEVARELIEIDIFNKKENKQIFQ